MHVTPITGKDRLDSALADPCSERYGGLIAVQLDPAQHYRVLKVGGKRFAFSREDRYGRALGTAWDLGFVPEPEGRMLGAELPDRIESLDDVDPDLADFSPDDLRAGKGRFSR